jgi:hypothetical protein
MIKLFSFLEEQKGYAVKSRKLSTAPTSAPCEERNPMSLSQSKPGIPDDYTVAV